MRILLLSLLVCLAGSSPLTAAHAKTANLFEQPLPLRQKIAHLYDRLAYGARPGEAEKLSKQGDAGIRKWLDEQLAPLSLNDESVEKKISPLTAVKMDPKLLLESFVPVQQVAMEMGIDKDEFQKNEELKKQVRQKIGEDRLPDTIVREMISQRLIRAVESRRQLQEMLVDFWLNHFNIDISKGQEKWLLPDFEREVIRKNLFGKFHDLLVATATHPAMLFYLDNHLSQSPIDYNPHKGNQPPKPKKNNGLNENYAREILELHTLGVDGGYTQKDVTELARILTGWSIDSKENPVYKFKPRVHDRGEKIFLGKEFPPDHGEDEGQRAIEILSHHPSTAKFIALKLCRAFVADKPPAALVAKVARKFTETQGDLHAVYLELLSSPEFWSAGAYRAKVKKPMQFAISAIRALGGELELTTKLPGALAEMGEDLYRCAPPTGYKDTAETWVNPGAMVSRLNLALKLASNHIEGVYTQLPKVDKIPSDSAKLVHLVEGELLHEKLSANSEKVVLHEFEGEDRVMGDGEIRPLSLSKAAGLILGSPEFQKR